MILLPLQKNVHSGLPPSVTFISVSKKCFDVAIVVLGFRAYMLSACQFFQKRTVVRGPRTGLFSSKIESNEFSEF